MLNIPYKFICGLLLVFLISGCTSFTVVRSETNSDPFEPFNRGVFAFNDGVDKTMLKPVAEIYDTLIPDSVDKGITNFFNNLDDIIVIANDLLQFKFKQAGSDTGRFLVNSTIGIIGFIDVATKMGLDKHHEDFGQTLGYWGIKSGPYLVLPLFGPSSVRDTFGLGADVFLDPRFYYAGVGGVTEANHVLASEAVKQLDVRADLLSSERVLQAAALDKYSYLRDAYFARREYLIYDGNPPLLEDNFEIEDDVDDSFLEDDLLLEEEFEVDR